MYIIRDRKAGNVIETVAILNEAVELLNQYEAEDKADGVYTKGFYEIVDEV